MQRTLGGQVTRYNMKYLANSFSLQMFDLETIREGKISFSVCANGLEEVRRYLKYEEVTSYIGHPDTAKLLGVPFNRGNVSLRGGDTLLVVQVTGGRLPEGCTELPEGIGLKLVEVRVLPCENQYTIVEIEEGKHGTHAAQIFVGNSYEECVEYLHKNYEDLQEYEGEFYTEGLYPCTFQIEKV